MFIVVGGASRSGTNSVTTFLHLHDDVMMCGTMKAISDASPEQMCSEVRNEIHNGRKGLISCITAGGTLREDKWRSYVEQKNERLLKGGSTQHVGIRWDYAETGPAGLRKAVEKGNAKLVFSMRNLRDIFISLCYNNFLKGNEVNKDMATFRDRISGSVDSVRRMGKNACPVLCSDGRDYERLLKWLGLEPSDLQKLWISYPPVTNYTNSKRGNKPSYSEYRTDMLNRVKVPTELENKYWSLLEEARANV